MHNYTCNDAWGEGSGSNFSNGLIRLYIATSRIIAVHYTDADATVQTLAQGTSRSRTPLRG